jgi:sulfate permease, SulP family
LLPAAIGIALVGYSDNVLTARAFARRNGYRVLADQELLALSLCNLSNGVMQGFPISSSGSRTALGESLGSKSQMFSLVAVAVTVAALLTLRPLLALFPKAALGALVIYAASRLIDVPAFVRLYQLRSIEFFLALGTTLGVVLIDIPTGVLLAVVASLLEWVWRMLHPQEMVDHQGEVLRYRSAAPLCFFNAQPYADRVRYWVTETGVGSVVLDLESGGGMPLDGTAIEMLLELRQELGKQGVVVKLEFESASTPAWLAREGEDGTEG